MPFNPPSNSPYNHPFNWIRQLGPGFSILGNMGNFLGKMPKVMQNAIAFDIETTGIGKHHAILEAAVYDIEHNRAIEYTLAPARVRKEQSRKVVKYMTSLDEVLELAQPWSRERIEQGQFSYLKDYFAAFNKQTLRQLETVGQVTVAGRTYLSPETFFRKFAQDIRGASGIYAANLAFENRQLATLFSTLPPQLQSEIKEQFLSYPVHRPNFLYRTADIHPYTTAAYEAEQAGRSSLSAWANVGRAYRRAPMGGMRAGDILDIGRSLMAEAKLGGFLRTADIKTGVGVETLAQAFGIAKKETHTAIEDAILQAKLQKRLVRAHFRLSAMRQGEWTGFMASMEGLVSGEALSDIQALQRIQAIQPALKRQNLQRQLAHLELALRGESVDVFAIKDQTRTIQAPQMVGGRRTWQTITYPTGPDIRQGGRAARRKYLPRFFNIAEKRLGLSGYGIDIRKEFSKVAAMETKQLWRIHEPTGTIVGAERLAARRLATMEGAAVWGRGRLLADMLTRYKAPMLALIGAGTIALSQLWNRISSSDDDYNTITALPERGLAQQLRHQLTDFGSGWVGASLKAFRSIGGRIKGLFTSSVGSQKMESFLVSQVMAPEHSIWQKLIGSRYHKVRGIMFSREHLEALSRNPNLSTKSTTFLQNVRQIVEERGTPGIPLFTPFKGTFASAEARGYSLREARLATAAHEYGHLVTLSPKSPMMQRRSWSSLDRIDNALYTKQQAMVERVIKSNKPLASVYESIQAQMLKSADNPAFRELPQATRDLYIHQKTISEIAAESVGAAIQKQLGYTGFLEQYGNQLSAKQIRRMQRLGRGLLKQSPVHGPIWDKWQANVLESFTHEGVAGATRRGNTGFGSGWTRDVTWSLPYEMSLTRTRAGMVYIEAAYELTKNIMRSRFVPPGLWQAGASMNVYNSSLPFSTSNTRSNIRNRYETSGLSSQLAGFSDVGQSAGSRSWNTGFGSGWKGMVSTADASVDFGGYREPVISPDYSGVAQYYNTEGYRHPRVDVFIQTQSPTRYMVDSISNELTQMTLERRVKDHFRKQSMAEQQISTAMKSFMDAKMGAKKHARRS